jgi:hypothetical protein
MAPSGAEDMRVFGFIPGTPETTIEFDPDTYTFTIAPVATNWSYYRDSAKTTITGSKQVVLAGSPPAAGRWFISITDDAGTLSASQTAWTLGATDTSVPVTVIEWNDALTPKYLLYDERHPADISRGMHAYAHLTRGAQYASGGAASGYTLQTATDAAITLALAAGVFYDETLRLDVPAITDPNGSTLTYLCRYRNGAGGWNWSLSEVPFKYASGSYIQYDNGSGTLQTGAANSFYNSWVLMTAEGYQIVQPQVQHGSLAAAQAETFQSLTVTGFNVAEYVAILRLTWRTGSAYSSKGKARLEAISTIQVTSIPAVAGTITASNVPVSAAPENYTPAEANVEAHLAGIDAALASTGGASWDAVETAVNATAAAFQHIETTASGLTITLPASPAEGAEIAVGVGDWGDTIVARNGQLINGVAENLQIDIGNTAVELRWVGGTIGWRVVK